MIAKAIDKILELKNPEIIEVEGECYSTLGRLTRISKDLRAKPIHLSTLEGLVEYINTIGQMEMGDFTYMINVISPERVELVSALDLDRERETLAVVESDVPLVPFGKFIDSERMVITLQSMFADDEESDKELLLKFAGTVTAGTVTDYGDDGVTQKATIKHGVITKAEAIVPSSVKLRPYRTFHEIEQPMSTFIFRMKEGVANTVDAALFEADGGAWKADAVHKIGKYFRDMFEGNIAVLS